MRFWPRKRFWIWFAIVAGVLLVINGILAWRAEWRLQSRLEAIRAAGDPASIADLAPEPIPDDQNAAAILRQIAPRIHEFASEHGRFYDTPLGKAYDEGGDRGEMPTPEQVAAIRAIVEKYADLDEALILAASCDEYASRLDFSLNHTEFLEALLAEQSDSRQAARFLAWKIEVDLAGGQNERAVERGIQILRLARLYNNEPTMVCFLIGTAVRGIAIEKLYDALAAGPIPSQLHAELDQELARHDDPQRLVNALKTERALGTGWFEVHTQPLQAYRFLARVLGWQMKDYLIGVLDLADEQLSLARRPWYEIRAQFGPVDGPTPPSGHGVIADLLLPAVQASFQANARNLAMLRSLRVFNALQAFADANGREASGLDGLSLPSEATIDPYSGEPLKLKHTDDGWIVYSVMENNVDDGGDFKDLKDYGVAPRRRRVTE